MVTSDFVSIAAVLVSLLSLIFSAINNFKQKKYIKTQEELNRYLLAKEKKEKQQEKCAFVSANIVKLGSSKYRIKVYNNGKSRAENVTFEFIDETNWMVHNNIFPLEFLDAGKSAEMGLSIFIGCESKAKILLSWEDLNGKNKNEVILTL